MCCAKEVSDLICHPVVILLGTRVRGTITEVVTKIIYLELLATTRREWHFRKEWNLGSNGVQKRISETSRPRLIFVMRPDLSQTTH